MALQHKQANPQIVAEIAVPDGGASRKQVGERSYEEAAISFTNNTTQSIWISLQSIKISSSIPTRYAHKACWTITRSVPVLSKTWNLKMLIPPKIRPIRTDMVF